MTSLVLAEVQSGDLTPAVARVLSAARQLGGPVDLLVVGPDSARAAAAAAAFDGVRQVLIADDPQLAGGVAEQVVALLEQLEGGYDAFLAPANALGKSVMPRLAAVLDTSQVSEVTGIVDRNTFEHPIYAGAAIETVAVAEPRLVLTIRAAAFAPAETGSAAAPVVKVDFVPLADAAIVLSETVTASGRPDLGTARVVVSGGRAFASREAFDALLVPLADRLGAAIGASRAAVDSGYAPNDVQVGQTGKVVAPDIYIAIGISGAVQHIAGMKGARIIVAINKDAAAPIFEIADYGLVGDLFDIVPELTLAMRS